jgi:hypothetical protein
MAGVMDATAMIVLMAVDSLDGRDSDDNSSGNIEDTGKGDDSWYLQLFANGDEGNAMVMGAISMVVATVMAMLVIKAVGMRGTVMTTIVATAKTVATTRQWQRRIQW